MHRAPDRPQRSPGGPQPDGRFPSPAPCSGFPGARFPYGGSGHRDRSPRGFSPYSTGSPGFSPGFSPGSARGYRNGSPSGFRVPGDSPSGFRGPGDSPSGFRSPRGYGDFSPTGMSSRGFRGQRRPRGDGFGRPAHFSPSSAPNFRAGGPDAPVERYYSRSMLQDPWKDLQPITAEEALSRRKF